MVVVQRILDVHIRINIYVYVHCNLYSIRMVCTENQCLSLGSNQQGVKEPGYALNIEVCNPGTCTYVRGEGITYRPLYSTAESATQCCTHWYTGEITGE